MLIKPIRKVYLLYKEQELENEKKEDLDEINSDSYSVEIVKSKENNNVNDDQIREKNEYCIIMKDI